ncbi:MAG: RNA polymerase sigma factor [Thermomicrobiales bacterium]
MASSARDWFGPRTALLSGSTVDPEDDAGLAARAASDRDAFARLYDRYVEAVYRYCYRRLGHREAAEDATSLVFTRALAAMPRYDAQVGSFRSWLFVIAHNVVTDRYRAARPVQPLDLAAEVFDPDPSPEDLAVMADQRRSVSAALAELSEEQRRVVELRLTGLTGPEIAVALGRTHATVRTTQRRALIRLRALLGVVPGKDQELGDG